ncbi:type III secretion system chaperone [Vibrio mangrovi]|uniref:DspF/AvrF protein n=1 Tax=Vibrio mangrovi TaxID=474394 RepID=A0A1Y6IWW9_9VIBR|nr:type III secretion system chaperone [Vibrio mangrovi]MDW6004691.1 type III secretion system chaperone [Vibrio mangrovi]SMS00982.1 DspF/AvrF protein [Vibrio mangrovi]
MNHGAEALIHELGEKIGIPLSVKQGATVLTDNSGREFWLEAPENSQLIMMHTSLEQYSVSRAGELDKLRWLALNARPDLMCGAWIGVHVPTDSVRLFVSAPIEFINVSTLEIILSNLFELSRKIPDYLTLVEY